ncbi:MAG: prepilin-type N-terminal cleavage/methylation domain-containing protein [Nitrospinae bacterium]|nr:prepilin-type N-terminal cleavage/methylation domain-containing protein [Nitrospinota bacterium]
MKSILRSRAGMTLVEVLMAVAIGSVIGLVIMKIFQSNSQLFSGEKKVTGMVTTGRNAMGTLSRLVREAGYNPTEAASGTFGLKDSTGNFATTSPAAITSAKSIFFTMDDNADGSLANNGNERVGFRFTGADCDPSAANASGCIEMAQIDAAGAISGWTSKIPDIQDLVFVYHYRTGSAGAYVFTDSVCGTVAVPATAAPTYVATAAPTATAIAFTCGGVAVANPPVGLLPDSSVTGRKYSDVVGVTIHVLAKTRAKHDLTKQNTAQLFTSSVVLRSR